MRKLILATMALAAMAAFCSCSDDNDEPIYNLAPNGKTPSSFGLMVGGWDIKSVNLYCLEKGHDSWDNKPWYEYYGEVKTLDDFSKMDLRIMFNYSSNSGNQGDPDELYAIELLQQEYERLRTSFIQDDYNAHRPQNGWPVFLTAYVRGHVTLTCDKVLYGEEAGSDLSGHFGILGESCIPEGIEEPTLLYGFQDAKPEVMRDYLADQTWVAPNYQIYPLSNPEERYEEIVLTVSFPIIHERTWDYACAKHKGLDEEMKREDKVLKAECKIRFR